MSEVFTIYSRFVNPAGVARRLRELCPQVEIRGSDEDWTEANVTLKRNGESLELKFSHDAEYYSEPKWSQQMAGFRGFFWQFPETDARQSAVWLTTTVKFSLGTLMSPALEAEDDPRLSILLDITQMLDGVLFTPTALLDAHFRELYSYFDDAEDPEAQWPKVRGEALADEVEPPDAEPEPPTVERVARRALALTALALTALAARGILEQAAAEEHAPRTWQNLQNWIEEIGVGDELEPDEWEVIQRPIGKLQGQMLVNATWRLEGLVVLAWSLGRFDVPPHDTLVDCNELFPAMGLLDADAAAEILASAALRPREEIEEFRRRQLAIHWRLRNYGLRPEVMDFNDFAQNCWFGPLDITGLPLADGDLALHGARIDEADQDVFGTCQSIAMERHQASNWLCWGPEIYSETDVST